ncbi:MAG: sugar phosphate isomerase/epimerase family protein [Armatimonadota bacterium]|nr:sugar phosphate isomerase/epimerase [Armatimonadota bacterium]MDW8142854.1 sugar phosphate isomerase/epimerase family protein [Armatimonadota bacterium]
MFVSIRDDVVLHGGFPSVVEGLSFLGIYAVEVSVGRDFSARSLTSPNQKLDIRSDNDLTILERETSQSGIRICAFLLGNDFGREDAKEQVEWMVEVVNAAHRLGISAIRVDAIVSGWEGMGIDKAINLFAENIKKVLDETENTDVHLGIENHGTLGNRPEFLQAVFDAVNSPRLGLTLDSGNFYWFGHPLSQVYEIMRQFASRVKHTHIKNISYPQEIREQQRPIGYEYGKYVCPIPDGDIDHEVVASILKEAGYAGDLCIEDESLGKFSPEERRDVLKRDAEYLKSLVSKL